MNDRRNSDDKVKMQRENKGWRWGHMTHKAINLDDKRTREL